MLDDGTLTNDDFRALRNGASLNADWVEWLMGWPIGWSSLEPMPTLRREPIDVEPADIPRVIEGQPKRASRLKAIGNGWVPQCAVEAWELLNEL